MASLGRDGGRMDRRAALLAFALFGLAALAAMPARALGPTYVHGDVSGLWTPEGSPYVLVENATVPVSSLLQIGGGVEVRANRGVGLQVLGSLIVLGTADALVHFTANGTTAPPPGFWVGIQATSPDLVSLNHAIVEGAQTGFGLSGGTADITASSFSGNFRGIAIEGAGATVSDTASSENTQAGIYARTASLSIQSALFSGDYVSLNLGATNALVENSTFLAATIG